MKEITDRLETGIQELFESERYKAYLTSMAKFHSYSFNNTLLIAMQGGQLVAGYNKWRDDFHRNVKRGEKGIKILAPAPYKVKKEVPKLDEQGQPVMDKDGNPVTEKKEIQVPAFKIVSVFDVSQTEGEPLPSIGVDELAGNVEQYEDFFKALEQTSPVPMAFEDIPGGSHGYYHLIDKRIAIQENMSELQTLKTAIHEIAHAKLHAIDPEAPVTEQADRPDSRTREVQAESVAYAVCQHYGLDTSDYSFGYVAGWSSGKDLKELRASLETIRATAHELITTIDGHLAELQQQRQAQQTVEQTVEPTMEQAAEQPAPDSVFSKLPPEQQQEMTDGVKAMLQTLIDADVKSTGEVTQGTLDAIQTQGFVLSGDGTLQRAEAQPEPQPWNGIDGLLNNKPLMPEATPTERANALIDWAERNGQRMGNEERRLIVEYAEAMGDTDKVIELINRLCEQGYEMQHGHMDDFVRSQIESEIAVAKAEQQTALDPAAEPVVTIIWSESPHLKDGQQMPLHEADAIFKELDSAKRYEREQPDYKESWYDKTKFRIDFTFQGQPDNYEGRQDFGDGDGSLIEHIRGYHEYYAQDESWKNHVLKHEGPEAWEADKAQRDMLLHEFVPYMSLHCNLAAMEQEARRPLQSGETLTPEQTAYFQAVLDYVKECRPLLNQGQYQLPEPPKLTDFNQSLQDYKAQVEAEIAQEAADAGMTVEEYAAAGYEATAPAQVVTSDAEPQAAPAETLTELQKKALEIADRYKDLPLQAKIDVIAQAFGCKTGEIHTSPCTGKWRGTSDMTIRFDNGASLFIGNHLTPKAKTVKVQTECVNRTLVQYNPEIVKATKEAALPALLQREAKDNEIAAQKGLKPYTLLNVEFNERADEKTGGYIGWYYVTLAVDGKICTHLETGLNHDIADGKVSDTPTRANYYPAGALKEADVDYVFNNVGFSSASTLYTVPLRDDVRERAEKTLAERSTAAPEAGREWGFYIIPDLKTWATHAEQQTPIEHFATFEEAKARFDELRSQPYNSEAKDLNTDGRPYAHLTLGMESKDGMSAADILHVRAGQNYLVEDFTRMERLRSDPVVLESLSRVAQEIGFDRVRPYVMENGSYKAMPDMPFTQWENPYFTVDPPAQEQGDTFAIYQLKGGPETRDYRFEAYESLQEAGLAVDRQNYDLVYTAPLDGKTTLEDIYRTFNLDRPADFTGHSLSVSDIVVLTRSGKEEAHYCDSFGFTPVPEFFLQREKQLTPRELLTGESIQTPRGSFLVTDMSREQLEAAGYGFHHQSEDGKYLIMGNGTDAFAIPAQQESPIKAAEMTTEQNYNMIDGVLNNAPTMSELEAKAKAGEQISLFDVAEAAKAEARKPKQPQRPAQKQKKPSIRAQLKAAKEEQQKKPPQREKTQELEV
uniref:YodL domain-containing protein n=1 Tax=Neglectibacter timonensis TaxID=1776382 RepID=UPI003AB35647